MGKSLIYLMIKKLKKILKKKKKKKKNNGVGLVSVHRCMLALEFSAGLTDSEFPTHGNATVTAHRDIAMWK